MQTEAYAIISEKCCFSANKAGQTISNLNVFKEGINIFSRVKEVQIFDRPDLFLELGLA